MKCFLIHHNDILRLIVMIICSQIIHSHLSYRILCKPIQLAYFDNTFQTILTTIDNYSLICLIYTAYTSTITSEFFLLLHTTPSYSSMIDRPINPFPPRFSNHCCCFNFDHCFAFSSTADTDTVIATTINTVTLYFSPSSL